MKINKSPTASNGDEASFFEIWMQISLSYPAGTLKPDIQMWTVLILEIIVFIIFWLKNKSIKTCWL